MTGLLRRHGERCARHPLVVIAAWLVLAAAVTALSLAYGGRYSQAESLPHSDSATAQRLLAEHFPRADTETAALVLVAPTAADLTRGLDRVEAAVRRLPHVAAVGPVQRDGDGRAALVAVRYDVRRFVLHLADESALRAAGDSDPTDAITAHVTGSLDVDAYSPATGVAEKVGIGVAVLVLVLAFGSVIAALMPVATAALALTTGLGVVKLMAAHVAVSSSAPALASMIGLGVGIDYALFIVTRHRERLRAGADPQCAAADATATAGMSVLWAGITVVAAICGLAFGGIPVISSLGFASAVVVAVSMLASLTILPALLSLTDTHIDALHLPMPHLRHERVGAPRLDPSVPVTATWWTRWAKAIESGPVRALVGATLFLLVLAAPVASLQLGSPDTGSSPVGTEERTTHDVVAAAFGPGELGPLDVVVQLPPAGGQAAVDAVRSAVAADPDVASVTAGQVSPDGAVAVLTAVPRSAPSSAATRDLVPRLRHEVLPPVEARTGARVVVAGYPAATYDVGQRVLDRLPWFVGAVLAMSFLLLMVVFRSILVPVKAVLLNLLSIAAALGIVVAVFQWGWLARLVGLHERVPVEDVVPMMMFAIVFGLSMDYEVFLLSRVREEWLTDGDGRGSVVRGLASTARVITAAAAIMVAVFASFTLSGDAVVKTMGLGLAVAVLLDATVIRLVLVPATMSLLGSLNWWLPRWLDRLLPHVTVDAAVPLATPYAVEAATLGAPRVDV